jgi:hypothetical protein
MPSYTCMELYPVESLTWTVSNLISIEYEERTNLPQGYSTFSYCTELLHSEDLNSCTPYMNLGALTKELASWLRYFESQQASLHNSLLCLFGTTLRYGEVSSAVTLGCESTSDVQAACIMQPQQDRRYSTCQALHAMLGHQCGRFTINPRDFHLRLARRVGLHRG